MQVILQENIKNIGQIGQQVNVKAGFARNYLIPQGKALPATADNMALIEAKRAELEKAALVLLEKAQERATVLNALSVSLSVNAGDEGKLFGSIGTRDVAEAINAAGVAVSKSEIDMPEGPIRQLGEHEINVKIHAELSAVVKFQIVAEKTES